MPKQDSGTLSAAILPVLAEFGGTTSDKFDRTYVPYPADYGFTGTSYKDSAARGVENASKIIADEAARCPNTKFGLLGYSQGAELPRAAPADRRRPRSDPARTGRDGNALLRSHS